MIFDPDACALCGTTERAVILERPSPSLASDGSTVGRRLFKVACGRCGLVRNGDRYTEAELDEHYGSAYVLARRAARAEPLIFGADGPVPRGRALADWVADAPGTRPATVLEVGCGEGSVLGRLSERWPDAELRGLDMSGDAVASARGQGLDVSVGSYEDASGEYDLVFSVAVIEHVPSPLDYLRHLSELLAPGGRLVSIQPHQDVASIDIFFSDHLHHFTTDHVAAFGGRAGLRELSRAAGHPLLPSFSRHVFEVTSPQLDLPHGSGAVRDAVVAWSSVFSGVDEWLAGTDEMRLAVWGAGQTGDALATYTSLGEREVDAVIDDNAIRFGDGWRGTAVSTFEESDVTGDEWAVLFTFRPPEPIVERVRARRIECYYFAV